MNWDTCASGAEWVGVRSCEQPSLSSRVGTCGLSVDADLRLIASSRNLTDLCTCVARGYRSGPRVFQSPWAAALLQLTHFPCSPQIRGSIVGFVRTHTFLSQRAQIQRCFCDIRKQLHLDCECSDSIRLRSAKHTQLWSHFPSWFNLVCAHRGYTLPLSVRKPYILSSIFGTFGSRIPPHLSALSCSSFRVAFPWMNLIS